MYSLQGMPSLSEPEAISYKQEAEDLLTDYYKKLNIIIGDSSMGFAQKDALEDTLIGTFFKNKTFLVFNDYKSDEIQDMPIKEYLDGLNVLYGDARLGLTFARPKITIPDVFTSGDSFFVKVEVDRTIMANGKPDLSNTKRLDYYLSFNRYNKDIRIYGVSQHMDNESQFQKALIEKPAAPVMASASTTIAPESAYLLMSIQPSNAEIKIDGTRIYFVNGMQIPIQPGTHRVDISAPHYGTYTYFAFNATEGENTISRELYQRTGELNLFAANNNAIGACVYIDGDSAGRLPLPLNLNLLEGIHSVQVFKEGYFAWKKNITIRYAEESKQQVSLQNIEKTEENLQLIKSILFPVTAQGNPSLLPGGNPNSGYAIPASGFNRAEMANVQNNSAIQAPANNQLPVTNGKTVLNNQSGSAHSVQKSAVPNPAGNKNTSADYSQDNQFYTEPEASGNSKNGTKSLTNLKENSDKPTNKDNFYSKPAPFSNKNAGTQNGYNLPLNQSPKAANSKVSPSPQPGRTNTSNHNNNLYNSGQGRTSNPSLINGLPAKRNTPTQPVKTNSKPPAQPLGRTISPPANRK
jgi:hypothetical protein